MENFKLCYGSGKCSVETTVVLCGNDLSVSICGGEKYHIGAAAVAVPRFEHKSGKKRTASTSLICVQGHREDEVTYKAAKYLATELECTAAVCMGIHIHDITREEFEEVMGNVDKLLEKVVEYIRLNR